MIVVDSCACSSPPSFTKVYKLLEFYRECGIGSKRDLQRLKTLRTYKVPKTTHAELKY